MNEAVKDLKTTASVERIIQFKGSDLYDLCDATEKTIGDGLGFSMGFNWVETPSRDKLESYWKGILLVPERILFVGRLDGVIAGAIQLLKPIPNNQAQNFVGRIREHFVAPWARGHGLAKMLLAEAEEEAKSLKLKIVKLEVRAAQEAAINMYEGVQYKRWGELDKYEFVDGKFSAGYYYYKDMI